MQTSKEAAATQAKEAQAALRRQLGAKLPASRKPRIVVSNSTNAEINGTYRSSEPHDGWPQFVNEHQYHLFYHVPASGWRIGPHTTASATWPASSLIPSPGKTLQALSADGTIPMASEGWCVYTRPHWQKHRMSLSLQHE